MIVEKKLGITPDYQFKAINSKNFLQANWHRNKLVAIEELIDISKQTKILDLGPGSGNLEIYMAKKCGHITAVDYNDEAIKFLDIKLSEMNISNVTTHVKNINKISELKLGEKYDLITMIDVIEHLNMQDAQKLVKYLPSLLNDSGQILIITPNYKSAWVIIEKILDKISIVPKFENEQHLAKFHHQNLSEIFKAAGLKMEQFKTFNYISYISPISILSKEICKIELSIPFKEGNLIAAVFSK